MISLVITFKGINPDGFQPYYLQKISYSGELGSLKTFLYPNEIFRPTWNNELNRTGDGGYIGAAWNLRFEPIERSYCGILRMNQNLDTLWVSFVGDENLDLSPLQSKELSSGGIITSGFRVESDLNTWSSMIFKLDEDGNLEWQTITPPINGFRDLAYTVVGTQQGDIITAGSTNGGGWNSPIVWKYDAEGNLLDYKEFGNPGFC